MALVDHARIKVLFNQISLVEVTSISQTTNSGQQRVDTLEGLAGFTPGSGDVSIDLGYAIPISGPEIDFQGICARGEYCTAQVVIGPKQYRGTGKVMDVTESQSVNANSEGSLSWVGELKAME